MCGFVFVSYLDTEIISTTIKKLQNEIIFTFRQGSTTTNPYNNCI